MPGDNGKLAVPYQLGKKGDELVFTLEKAEFASRALVTGTSMYAAEDGRLLVLTYSVQNPATVDRAFFNQSFSFTVVSPDDENFVCDGVSSNGMAAYHPDRKDELNLQLKPAQKVKAIAFLRIHPQGPINKLIVQRGKGTPVLRYDLKEKIKPMTGPFAADEGLGSIKVGAASLTTMFELGPWDVTVEKVEELPGPIGDWTAEDGQKLVVVTVSVKNVSKEACAVNSSTIVPKMTDEDGSELTFPGAMLKVSSTDSFSMQADPDAQMRFRYLFYAPAAAKPMKLAIKDYYSERTVSVLLSPPK